MEDAKTSTIELVRTSQFANAGRAYSICIDGAKVGSVRDGQTSEFPVSPGTHSAQARIDWCRSRPLEVEVAEGEKVSLEVGCNSRGWRLLLQTFYVLWPYAYLYVRAI